MTPDDEGGAPVKTLVKVVNFLARIRESDKCIITNNRMSISNVKQNL